MGRKIKIYEVEEFTTTITKEPITINTDDYPELEGMSNDEITEYVIENGYNMKSQNEHCDSLYEDLSLGDVIKEKQRDLETTYVVEDADCE